VWSIDPAGEEPAGLHHLMPGVMHCRGRVVAGANERELVREFGVQRKHLRNLEGIARRADGLERPANLARRIGLHVEQVELRWSAEIENQDAGFVALLLVDCTESLKLGQAGKREAQRTERAHLKKISAREAIAGGDRSIARDFEHSSFSTGFVSRLTMASGKSSGKSGVGLRTRAIA
jgi:hypothetical protein